MLVGLILVSNVAIFVHIENPKKCTGSCYKELSGKVDRSIHDVLKFFSFSYLYKIRIYLLCLIS